MDSSPAPNRRISEQQSSKRFKPETASYSHINIQPASNEDNNKDLESDNTAVEGFVRHESLQGKIEEGLTFAGKSASRSPSKSPDHPRTFAEAAMSTRRGRRNSMDDSSDSRLSGPMSLESLGTFKYTLKKKGEKKKKKSSKWSPLDLSAGDGANEVGSHSEVGSSRAASPNPNPNRNPLQSSSIFGNTITKSKEVTQSTNLSRDFDTSAISNASAQSSFYSGTFNSPGPHATPGKGKGISKTDLEFDADPTPTQPRFDTPYQSHPIESDFGNSLDLVDSDASDSQSTKDRTEAAMAAVARAFGFDSKKAGADAFDSVEWDPDLSAVPPPDKSPEPITVKSQPVSYTTVGSVINPNAVPQITAPNRIQREGSNRRPLMMMPLQNRQYEMYFQPRGPPPPLSMQNSMQYTQQLGQSPIHYNHTPPPQSTRSSQPRRSNHKLTMSSINLNEQEKQVLMRQGLVGPQMFSGNMMTSPSTPTPANKQFSSSEANSRQVFSVKELMEEEAMGRSNSIQGPVQGLEKMQTLQRLAKFDNPMQELARSRLSEFSIAKSQITGKALANPTGESPFEKLMREQRAAGLQKMDMNLNRTGELDRGYQFPPPGFTNPSASRANPLYGAYNSTTSQTSAFSRRPGYPQPLTAGPPGQRQCPGGPSKLNASYVENIWEAEGRSSTYNLFGNPEITSPWSRTYPNTAKQAAAQPVAANQYAMDNHTKPLDTLSLADAAKYYPNGFPADMTGNYTPLPYDIQKKMGQTPDDEDSAEAKKAKKTKELNDWWYSGQRRYGMSAEDRLSEMEEHLRPANPFGPIAPPSKKVPPPVEKKPLSIDDMKKMTVAEAAVPLLDNAFGSLLAYAARDTSSSSRRVLSKFEQSPAWQIDNSEKGNASFFGEDWGAPPKRTGGDPRD